MLRGPEIGKVIGSSIGLTGLFGACCAAAGDFTPLWFFFGLITITAIVLALVIGGAWAGNQAYVFFSGKYFNYELSRSTEMLPPPQDPYTHVP